MTYEEFIAVLDEAKEKGWVSDMVCSMHSGVPTTNEEDAAFEKGDDPCAFVVRIWGEDGKDGE